MARIKINDIDIERELADEELEQVFGGQGGEWTGPLPFFWGPRAQSSKEPKTRVWLRTPFYSTGKFRDNRPTDTIAPIPGAWWKF